MENKLDRNYLIYKTSKIYNFQKYKTTRSSVKETFNNDISLDDALERQIRLKDDNNVFKESTKPKESVKKEKNSNNS